MQNKRMFKHDYTRIGFYMVTILTAGRRPFFGVCQDNRVDLSPAGKVIKRRWREIPLHRPEIEASDLVLMPDHLHGIVYVKKQLAKPVGNTIRGFKSGVTSELRREAGGPMLSVWEESFHDRIIMNSESLRAERQYIRDNPRRYCLRKMYPELFVKTTRLSNSRLPQEMDWTGFGNLFLLNKPDLMPVQVSREATVTEISSLKDVVKERVSGGTVMVSPFISPGERKVAELIIEQDYGSLILLKPEGFPPLYKPPGKYFDLCAKGRLLVLSPFVYTGRRQPFTRERCLRMNEWVRTICGNNAATR